VRGCFLVVRGCNKIKFFERHQKQDNPDGAGGEAKGLPNNIYERLKCFCGMCAAPIEGVSWQ
jgi:hypothetical protein